MSSENPDLNMVIIFATLIAFGNIPVVEDKFISLHSDKVRDGADIFSSLIGILEGPEDLESSKDCIIFNISSSDGKAMTKKLEGLLNGLGIVLSVFGPTLAKKLLNALPTFLG